MPWMYWICISTDTDLIKQIGYQSDMTDSHCFLVMVIIKLSLCNFIDGIESYNTHTHTSAKPLILLGRGGVLEPITQSRYTQFRYHNQYWHYLLLQAVLWYFRLDLLHSFFLQCSNQHFLLVLACTDTEYWTGAISNDSHFPSLTATH